MEKQITPSSRFIIASKLTLDIDREVRMSYQHHFHTPCPIHTLHCTLIPPFSIKSSVTDIQNHVRSIAIPGTQFTFGLPNTFATTAHKILYLPIEPKQPLVQMYQQLTNLIQNEIVIEKRIYDQNKIPEFLPHVSLDYDFKHTIPTDWTLKSPFSLAIPELLTESKTGIWIPVNQTI